MQLSAKICCKLLHTSHGIFSAPPDAPLTFELVSEFPQEESGEMGDILKKLELQRSTNEV